MSKSQEGIYKEIAHCRQRIYQLRHKKLGLCFRCPNPVIEQRLLWKGKVVFKKKMVNCWVHLLKDRQRELVQG